MNRILGIVGMCGSGKSVVTQYLVNKGWKSIYFGGVTINEVKKRGLIVNETNERLVREDLRREFGPAAYAIKLAPIIKREVSTSNVVLDGLYSWQEYCYLKEVFGDEFSVTAVIADKDIRYNRLAVRATRPLSSDEASQRDIAEIENLAKGGPIAIADHYLINNGTEKELFIQIDSCLELLL